MMPVMLIVFAAVIGCAAMAGTLAYVLNRIRQIETGTTGEAGSHQLVDQVNLMREELLTVQDEMSSFSERLDFTEKFLMSGDDTGTSDASDQP